MTQALPAVSHILTDGRVVDMIIASGCSDAVIENIIKYLREGWKITGPALYQLEIHFSAEAIQKLKQMGKDIICPS